jgi:hypothetical protein
MPSLSSSSSSSPSLSSSLSDVSSTTVTVDDDDLAFFNFAAISRFTLATNAASGSSSDDESDTNVDDDAVFAFALSFRFLFAALSALAAAAFAAIFDTFGFAKYVFIGDFVFVERFGAGRRALSPENKSPSPSIDDAGDNGDAKPLRFERTGDADMSESEKTDAISLFREPRGGVGGGVVDASGLERPL